jgi:hypothetical protein
VRAKHLFIRLTVDNNRPKRHVSVHRCDLRVTVNVSVSHCEILHDNEGIWRCLGVNCVIG